MFNKKMNPDQHSDTPGNQTPPGAPPLPAQPQERSTPRASGAPAPTESTSSASTVLAEGAKFVGKANVAGTFRVEGLAEGEIQASENLIVANVSVASLVQSIVGDKRFVQAVLFVTILVTFFLVDYLRAVSTEVKHHLGWRILGMY